MKLTSWCIKLIVLFSVLLILQGAYDIGVLGAVLVAITAVIWAVCSYIDGRWY